MITVNEIRGSADVDVVVDLISRLVELHDPHTALHQLRVALLCERIGSVLGLGSDEFTTVVVAARVHDVGKLSLPSMLLSKPGPLSESEWGQLRSHVLVGMDVLETTWLPKLAQRAVLEHHERLDGSGYPYGLSGEEIGLGARILAVADVVEAVASHRPYRAAMGVPTALELVNRGAGREFDADVVAACLFVFATDPLALDR